MRLLVFGSSDTKEVKWILKAAQDQGHEAKAISHYDVTVKTGREQVQFYHPEFNLLGFDAFLFRGITAHLWEALLMARWLYQNKKIVVDKRLATEQYIPTKLSTSITLSQAGLMQPKTYKPGGIKAAKELLKDLAYPVVLKDAWGSKGQGMILAKNKNDALNWIRESKKIERPYLVQEYIPVKNDTRVFIVGDKVLGGMRRTAPKEDWRANIAVGGTAKAIKVPKEMATVALKAKDAMKMEIVGVDILEHKGAYYVLEVNRCPQFKGFQTSTGINVGKEIVNYIASKHG